MISLAVSRPPENLSTSPKELSRSLKLLIEFQKSSAFLNTRYISHLMARSWGDSALKNMMAVLVCPHLSGWQRLPQKIHEGQGSWLVDLSAQILCTKETWGSKPVVLGCLIGDKTEGWRKKQPFTIIHTFQMMNLFLLREYITMYLSVFGPPFIESKLWEDGWKTLKLRHWNGPCRGPKKKIIVVRRSCFYSQEWHPKPWYKHVCYEDLEAWNLMMFSATDDWRHLHLVKQMFF